MSFKIIAWDFDGVLNKNMRDGKLIWKATFAQDLGVEESEFSEFMFRSGRFDAVLIGARDVKDLVQEWLAQSSCTHSVDDVLHYWFSRDALPDAKSLNLLKRSRALGFKNVLATNNEPRRVAYIEEKMGFADHLDQVFAAGRMGVKKPDPAFYRDIEMALSAAPEDILFIDDKLKNVDAAKALGWHGFHFHEGDYIGLEHAIFGAPSIAGEVG